MNVTVTNSTVASIPPFPSAKRRIIQNIGAGDVYYHNDANASRATILAEGIRLKGGVDLILLMDENTNQCGAGAYFASTVGSELRYLDTK